LLERRQPETAGAAEAVQQVERLYEHPEGRRSVEQAREEGERKVVVVSERVGDRHLE
jgi:hypothetical protein